MRPLIPDTLHDEFISYMRAADNDDLPDGAWFQMLHDAAEEFMRFHKLRGDSHDAVLLYTQIDSDVSTPK